MIRINRLALACLYVLFGAGCGSPDSPSDTQDNGSGQAKVATMPDTSIVTKPANAKSDCLLAMGWDPWEPYQYATVDSSVAGLDVEIVSAIAERAGCKLSFLQDDWATLLKMLKEGKVDFLAGATRTPARESFAWFSDSYRHEMFALYVRRGESENYEGNTLEDLLSDNFRVGVTNDYVYSDEVAALENDARYSDQFEGVPVGELNFERLKNLEIDGFLEDPFVAAAMMRKRDLSEDVEEHTLVLDSGPVNLMFSKASVDEDTVKRMNQGLAAIRSDGTYDRLLARYRR